MSAAVEKIETCGGKRPFLAPGQSMEKSSYEREEERQRRRAYYEQLSPEAKRAFREKRMRARRRRWIKGMMFRTAALFTVILLITAVVLLMKGCGTERPANGNNGLQTESTPGSGEAPDWVIKDFIRKNKYSRPGDALEQINGIVVHYVGNPGTSAEQNRNYFDGLADSGERSAGSHFIIGIDGTIIQAVPLDEIAYASNDRNVDTISIECCHPDESGKFTQATYDSLVKLVKWLKETYQLEAKDVIRHYDVTGKDCPRYFVQNPEAWEAFLQDVETAESLQK